MPWTAQPRLVRRLVQLYAGLVLYGFSASLILLSGLGNVPGTSCTKGSRT